MIFTGKKDLRKFFLQKRVDIPMHVLKENSSQLCKNLISLKDFELADTILFFYPTKNEPELFEAMFYALENKKNIAFPISRPDDTSLDFRLVGSLSELKMGTYKIPEPSGSLPVPTITENSLCIAPALAFDKNGFRLGYGKGYYDKFLSSFKGKSIGLVMDGFLCDSLPIDSNDIPVDILITQTGVVKQK